MFGTHEHLSVATTLNTLGLLAQAQGKYDEAQQCYKEDLDIYTKMFGMCEHVDVATILLNLGALAVDQRKFDEAQKYLDEAFAIYIKAYHDEDHPSVKALVSQMDRLEKLRNAEVIVSNAADPEISGNQA
ncbi:hypothetical protein HK100_010021, partial [Physocladia obscura]